MRFTSLYPACVLLALASASPNDEDILLNDLVEDEIHVFKRDALITPRDVELAQRDGIDLDESKFTFILLVLIRSNIKPTVYRHSVIKRDDGDHVTIWVAKSYNESSQEQDDPDKDVLDPKLAARSKLKIGSADVWSSTPVTSQCDMSRTSYIGYTGPNAPFTGGVDAIVRWGNNCGGWWWLGGHNVVQNLIVAGSASGFNVRFTVQGIRNIPSTTDRRVACAFRCLWRGERCPVRVADGSPGTSAATNWWYWG